MKIAFLIVAILACLLGVSLSVPSFFQRQVKNENRNLGSPTDIASADAFARFESGEERKDIEMKERERLNSYGWIDRKNGIVHIPIEAAMKMASARNEQRGEQQK